MSIKTFAAACALALAASIPAGARPTAQTGTYTNNTIFSDSTVTTVTAQDELPSFSTTGDSIVEAAMKYIGARYRRGHAGPYAFDCSGFTSYVYGKEGIKLSRSSRTQSTQGRVIERIADLQKGDLVFFGGSRSPRTVGHVGIVTEVDPDSNNFKFIHASNSGVKISASNSAYYGRRYLGARRILNTETE